MKIATVTLKSASPYGQSKYHGTEMLDKEGHADYEKRTWRERCHYDGEGEVFIPAMAFKKCLGEAAQYLSIQIKGKGKRTYTKHFKSGVAVFENAFIGVKKDEMQCAKLFVPADGKPGGGRRVEKWFPYVSKWQATITFHILDETITKDVFVEHLDQAGKFIGLGFWRPARDGMWGRFTVAKVKWQAA